VKKALLRRKARIFVPKATLRWWSVALGTKIRALRRSKAFFTPFVFFFWSSSGLGPCAEREFLVDIGGRGPGFSSAHLDTPIAPQALYAL